MIKDVIWNAYREPKRPEVEMKAEHVELRFGIIAREMGFITAEQLVEALKIQVMEEAENKKHRQIGTILLEKGFINEKQIEEVIINIMKRKSA